MKFNVLLKTNHSITIEVINDLAYYTDELYDIYLNGNLYKSKINTNIFTIFNLSSDSDYLVSLVTEDSKYEENVHTLYEYVTLNVLDFGAKGDGVCDDTSSIQAAILSCPKDGRVLIPAGTYSVKPLFLKSDITIELLKDATLLGNTDRKNYPILPGMTFLTDESDDYNLGSWEGNPLDTFASIITAVNVSNVNIIGEGTIDGNAENGDWWQDVRIKRIAWRPRGMFLNHCENITVCGITIKNTPSWNLHPYFSKNIKFIDMKVLNPSNSPNTDGCDPESCDGVDIIGVHFSVGDDCIAIKSGKIYMGKKYKKPSENFNIRNCSMNFGHGAVVLGSEMAGGIKNITVNRCIFNETDRGLRIKTRRGRGKDAVIDGIKFENIKMNNVLTPLVINMFYFCDPDGKTEYVWSKEALPVDDRTPYLGKFTFENIDCENVNVAAGAFYGLPEMPIEEINIFNVHFNYSENPKEGVPAMMTGLDPMKNRGLIFNNVKHVHLKNVSLNNGIKDEVELNNVSDFTRE